MEPQMGLAWAMIFCIAVAPVYGEYYSETVTPPPTVEKVSNLHFFLHDIISGEKPTAVLVARDNRNVKNYSPISFGNVFAIDDPLTEGPEPKSKIIGNAQGIYVSTSQDPSKFTIVMYTELAFTSGKFNGSSFSILSRNPVLEAEREVAVVGGRGQFSMARGFVKIKSQYFDEATGDAILDYSATLYHY